MKIERITLKNYKAFKDITITDIPSLCVFVGANGSGKTSLFGVFGFLHDCLTYDVKRALEQRGGFKEVISRNSKPDDCIEILIKFRLKITGANRLVTYELHIGEEKSKPVVKKEILSYKRGRKGLPFRFLNFSNGQGYAINNEEDFDKTDEELKREEQKLAPEKLAISGLGQFQRFKAAYAFRDMIEKWHISDFHINQARGLKDTTGDWEHLSLTGDNLQLVARNLYENHAAIFNKIVSDMEHRVPGVNKVAVKLTDDGRLLLQFSDNQFQDPFIDRYVSDGTIKMFAYLVLLNDPQPHPLLCIEEPENQLYPKLLAELVEEFRTYANRGGQVFVSTHSPDLLNALKLDEVFWLVKEKGFTQIYRAKDDKQLKAYMDNGDKLGYLWNQGIFEGVDP